MHAAALQLHLLRRTAACSLAASLHTLHGDSKPAVSVCGLFSPQGSGFTQPARPDLQAWCADLACLRAVPVQHCMPLLGFACCQLLSSFCCGLLCSSTQLARRLCNSFGQMIPSALYTM